MNDTTLLVEVPNTMRHLKNDVPREVLTEVGKLNDLVEELAALHYYSKNGVKSETV